MKLLLLALPLPLFALIVVACRNFPRRWSEWKPYVQIVSLLFVLGSYVANPFLGGTALGTGEAYNYSLSIADGVTQYRSGIFPILVGQTEYAFNGRIHPLRTAPYFVYAACALDAITFHRLNFWELQNLLLTLSIIGGTFSSYAALRYLVGASRRVALGVTALFMLSPGVLSVIYAMDLYMTVTTLPFLPMAIAASVASFHQRSFKIYLIMGLSIAFTWLSHPPIALWVSAATVVLQAVVWLRQLPTLKSLAALIAGAAVGLAIAVYGFVSTLTMQDGGGLTRSQDYSPMLVELQHAFPSALLPISANANLLSDFQLGYVFWLVLLIAAIVAIFGRRIEAVLLCMLSVFFVSLALPIPHVSWWLWLHLPPAFPNLTNIWPMQRLYLVTSVLIAAAAAALSPQFETWRSRSRVNQYIIATVYIAALIWVGWQAQPFLHRGNEYIKGKTTSQDLHRSENIDLTVISYAMVGVPSYFYYGVIDPERWFRLLKTSDRTEIANNWSVSDPGMIKANGAFRIARSTPDEIQLTPSLHILPHRKYQLVFNFRTPPVHTLIVISGEHMRRQYVLPSSDQTRGFGMNPGNQNSLILWTTNPAGEDLEVRLNGAGVAKDLMGAFANFTLYEINPLRFPVQVDKWVPLQGTVQAPEGIWLETPRRYIPGYAATVDGRAADLQISPEGSVMFKVPGGRHAFQLSYPGPLALRRAFWISFAAIALMGIGLLVGGIFVGAKRIRKQLETQTNG